MTPDWLLDKLSTLPTDPNQRALFTEREPAPERTRGLPMFAREWRKSHSAPQPIPRAGRGSLSSER